MAKKNAKMPDSNNAVVLDLQNRAVMTNTQSNAEIKRKVQQVLEVVPDVSHQNIILVLQHYENDVQRAIQAFLEGDGAKEVLSQWRHSGFKEPKKKRKNKQQQLLADQTGPTQQHQQPAYNTSHVTSGPQPPLPTQPPVLPSLPTDQVPSSQVLTLATPGAGHDTVLVSTVSQPLPQRGDTSRHGASRYDTSLYQLQDATSDMFPYTQSATTTPVVLHPEVNGSSITCNGFLSSPDVSAQSSPVDEGLPGSVPHPAMSATPHASIDSGSVVSSSQSSPAVALAQISVAFPPPNRPSSLEGSKSQETKPHHTTSATQRPGAHSLPPSQPHHHQQQPQHHQHHHHKGVGLEKATKDLQRQVASLHRLQLRLAENCDQAQRKITSVFQDAKKQLEEKEVHMMVALNLAKDQAADLLRQRQFQATELRKRVDLANAMKDPELHELRSDIKHFASERKIDEELAETDRFQCDVSPLLKAIEECGKVVPVQHTYRHRRPSASSVSSSVVSDLTPLSTPSTPLMLSMSAPTAPVPGSSVPATSSAKVLGQSDSVTEFEQTKLPKILQQKKDQQNSYRDYHGRGGYRGGRGGRGGYQGNRGQQQQQQQQQGPDSQNGDGGPSRTARRRQRQRERTREVQDTTQPVQEPTGGNESNQPQRQGPQSSNRGQRSPRRGGQGRPSSPRKNRPNSNSKNPEGSQLAGDVKEHAEKHVPNGIIFENNNSKMPNLEERKPGTPRGKQPQRNDRSHPRQNRNTDRQSEGRTYASKENTTREGGRPSPRPGTPREPKELGASAQKAPVGRNTPDGAKPQRPPRGAKKEPQIALSNGHVEHAEGST